MTICTVRYRVKGQMEQTILCPDEHAAEMLVREKMESGEWEAAGVDLPKLRHSHLKKGRAKQDASRVQEELDYMRKLMGGRGGYLPND